MPRGKLLRARVSARYLFLILIGTITIGEVLVMMLLHTLPPMPIWGSTLLDAALLLLPLFPLLYFAFFRPLAAHSAEHERMAALLRTHESQLRATLESTVDGILAVDNDGKVLHTNRRFAELWHIPSELLARGDDRELLAFVIAQLADPDAFLAKVEALYGVDAEDADTLQFRDGRTFERFSVPMMMEGRRIGRVWSFRDVTERNRATLEREVLREFAEGVATSSDLADLLRMMHHALQRVVAAENCFVALHDARTDLFDLPYFADQHDVAPAQPVAIARSCTAYVFRSGAPTLITPSVFRRLQAAGDVELVGSPSPSWMGVPLRTPAGMMGVLVLQHYEREDAYDERDLAFLASIGSQAAVAIERKLAEDALRSSERRLREAQELAKLGSWELDLRRNTVSMSDSLCRLVARDPARPPPDLAELSRYFTPESWDRLSAAMQTATTKGTDFELDLDVIREDGALRFQTGTGIVVRAPSGEIVGLRGTVLDITARRQAEVAAAAFEARLQQSQRLESVGRLAGGIAHDFNNLLAVILGNVEFALHQVDPARPIHADLVEIENAARRSADLTRQLLAYARRQTVVPIVLDLNQTVFGQLALLQQLLGEQHRLDWQPATDLWPVAMDPSQLANVLSNLCLNARDAMVGPGTVSLATANVLVDAVMCATHPEAVPGDHVRLTVEDTGRGMAAETMARAFEPFFTTKDVGEGTGLGLAEVYGAVQQNGGFATVRSALGQGTTFELFLPRRMAEADAVGTSATDRPAAVGKVVVLLVEDESSVLRLATRVLSAQGYDVLAASGPSEAVRLATSHSGEIHLLLTDVMMPVMNGRELAKALRALRPNLRQLFMSGHTADVIATSGLLPSEVDFIEKPFTPVTLAAKVREVLDRA